MAANNPIQATGRRKESAANVRMTRGSGKFTINSKPLADYFKLPLLIETVKQPFQDTEEAAKYDIAASVKGGGFTGQAEATRLAIARALVLEDPEKRPILKASGLLTRDPRAVERKKPGQPKARKKFTWVKR
jgi:small subunit ribosomal protein S9